VSCNNGRSCSDGLKFASYCCISHFTLAHVGCTTTIGRGLCERAAQAAKGTGLLPGQGDFRYATQVGAEGKEWLRELHLDTPTSATIDSGRRLAGIKYGTFRSSLESAGVLAENVKFPRRSKTYAGPGSGQGSSAMQVEQPPRKVNTDTRAVVASLVARMGGRGKSRRARTEKGRAAENAGGGGSTAVRPAVDEATALPLPLYLVVEQGSGRPCRTAQEFSTEIGVVGIGGGQAHQRGG
jgi:hypothetical protein